MARHYIGYTARGATVLKNVRSDAGYPLVLMEEGETRKVSLNFSALLETGESISTATASGDGVTVTASLSSPTVTLTLSAPSGWSEVTLTVTLSNGETIVETIRVRQNARGYDPSEIAYTL